MHKPKAYFLCIFIALQLQGYLVAFQESKVSEPTQSQDSPHHPERTSIDFLKLNEIQGKLDRIAGQQAVLKEALEKVQDQQTALAEEWRKVLPLPILERLEDQQKTLLLNLPKNIVPPKFEKIGERFFYIEKETEVNWFAAANTCRQMGGHLATIQSEEERVAIVAKLPRAFFWLGINNLANANEFVSTVTGQEAPFIQWGSGQPNKKVDDVPENCLAIVYELMHDYRCDKKMRFICEASV